MTELLDIIHRQINHHIYHGASVALFKNGQWTEYYIGTIDGKQPTKPHLLYDLASVSKVVGIGTVMSLLLYQGKIELDTPVAQHYPDFHDSSVTLRQLVTHTSGINPFIKNRNQLNAKELKEAIKHITVEKQKVFFYTDINFLLLGFMLEHYFNKPLNIIFKEHIFQPFAMKNTGFGPVKGAVPTISGIYDGVVHDPKAKILGCHSGSAGLFSNIHDLEIFCLHYLRDDFANILWNNFSSSDKERSIAWNKSGDWLDHTGYTGTYVAINRTEQKAAIFLTNRTYSYDDRNLWIKERKKISQWIQDYY